MDAGQVLKLLDAGFSAEEIRALMEGAKPEPEKQEPEKQEQKKQEQKKKEDPPKAKEAAKEEEPEKKEDKSDKILDAIDKLTGSITTFMITSTGRVTPDEKTTVDEVLSKILFPDGEEA